MKNKIIILIPAYQPNSELKNIVEELKKEEYKVIVIDDGSTKNLEIFKQIKENAVVLHQEENKGKGNAIKIGLNYILQNENENVIIGTMDADGQHLVSDMILLLNIAGEYKNTLVIGSRKFEDKNKIPLKSRLGNKITRKLFYFLTKNYIEDTQTGLRVFDINVAKSISNLYGNRYEYEMNVLLECIRKKIDIKEVPIKTIYNDKSNSSSHFKSIKDSVVIYKLLFNYKFKRGKNNESERV